MCAWAKLAVQLAAEGAVGVAAEAVEEVEEAFQKALRLVVTGPFE